MPGRCFMRWVAMPRPRKPPWPQLPQTTFNQRPKISYLQSVTELSDSKHFKMESLSGDYANYWHTPDAFSPNADLMLLTDPAYPKADVWDSLLPTEGVFSLPAGAATPADGISPQRSESHLDSTFSESSQSEPQSCGSISTDRPIENTSRGPGSHSKHPRCENSGKDSSNFACPFYKYDPLLYSGHEWKACMAGRFEIPRLK